jgi:ferric-dicitrate binding protein FerR (iron transport regulator)
VLGTKFNVNDYANEPNAQVALICGRVEVGMNGEKNILAPNQVLSYDRRNNETQIATADAAEYIAWTEGYYPFKQECLGVALHKLSKYYGVEFEWDAQINTLKCSGKFDLKEDLSEAMRALEKTAPIRITPVTGNKYKVIVKP